MASSPDDEEQLKQLLERTLPPTPTPTTPPPPAPTVKARGRARSGSIRVNPLAVPLTQDEQSVANLIQRINRNNAASAKSSPPSSTPSAPPKVDLVPIPKFEPPPIVQPVKEKMNYQNYPEPPTGGQPSNSRQAPPSPSQNMSHANAMNGGGMGVPGSMVGFPTPAGHQSDLNYIMQMVEDLSRQLETNQRITAGVVEKIGKVREKAKTMDLNNDELIALVASEMNDDTQNLEKEISELRKKLEKSEYNRNENWKLVLHSCNILSDILEKMHKFKEQHEKDTLAWHKNYRKQLADERQENLNLRNQINDMKAAAARANSHLRDMRRYLTDHDELHELRVQNIAYRLERRSWKRMALKHLRDSDSEFSDDDDLIDPEEKKRVAAALAKDRAAEEAHGSPGPAGAA